MIGLCVVAITLVTAVPAGYSLARMTSRSGETLGIGIFLTYLVPPTLLFLPLSRIIAVLGLQNSMWSLVVVYPTFTIPFCTWLLMGFFKAMPPEIEEAAIVDGCSLFGAFVKMVIPLSVPAILTVVIFTFTLTLQEFVYALTFVSASDQKPITLGVTTDLDPRRRLLLGRDHGRRADRQHSGGDRLQPVPRPVHLGHHRRRRQIGGAIGGGRNRSGRGWRGGSGFDAVHQTKVPDGAEHAVLGFLGKAIKQGGPGLILLGRCQRAIACGAYVVSRDHRRSPGRKPLRSQEMPVRVLKARSASKAFTFGLMKGFAHGAGGDRDLDHAPGPALRPRDQRLEFGEVEKRVGPPAQFVGDHRRRTGRGRDHGDANAAALHGFHQRAKVAVAREQHHLVEIPGKLHRLDRELDAHIALHPPAAGRVDELLRRLGDDRVAIIVQPVDERPDGGKLLILVDGGVVQRPQQPAALAKFGKQPSVIDVEAESLGGGVEVGTVDEQGDPAGSVGKDTHGPALAQIKN